MNLFRAVVALAALGACTPGASAPPNSVGSASASVVDVNLTTHDAMAVSAGTAGGYAPLVTTVALGSAVRFVNSDGFAHTASSFGGTLFPAGSPLAGNALARFGDRLSSAWSTGSLGAGGASQTLVADRPGTYLYGCFYHYGAPMRGAIVVR